MNSGDLRALREYRSPFEFVVEEALNDRKREQELKEEVEKEHKKKLFKSHKGKEADGPVVTTTSSSSIVTPTSWMLDDEEEEEEVLSPLALIPPELLESIFLFCDPKSLLSFRFVCKLWCSLIDSSNNIWRTKCSEVFDLIPTRIRAWSPASTSTSTSVSSSATASSSSYSRSTEQPSQTSSSSSSSSSSNEPTTGISPSIISSTSESMETKLAVNASLWQLLYAASLKSFKGSLISEALSASSQDRKEERIEETLHLSPIGYWGSKGSDDEDSSEKLLYYLATPTSIVTSLEIMPFRAHFQAGSPVYAPKACRFIISTDVTGQNVSYTSPIFPVAQTGTIQKFEIRRTLVCGSYLTVELLGRTQKQQGDNLYYTCLQYVALRGTPICNFAPAYNTESRDWELEYRSAGSSERYVENCLTFLEEKQEEIQKQQQKKLNFYCRFLRIPEVMRHLERLPEEGAWWIMPSTDYFQQQQQPQQPLAQQEQPPPQEDEEEEEADEEEELDGAEGTENLLYMLMNAEGESNDADEDGYHDEDAIFD